jgi:transcriptional regulator with XRE-family HTH domain
MEEFKYPVDFNTSNLMLTKDGIYCRIYETDMKRPTNFDPYLEEQLKDPDFAERFKKAGEAWDVAIKLASLRKASGLSQKELAKRVGTSQQQISRLESPSYEGHSLSMLRRVAEVLGGTVRVEIQHKKHQTFSLPKAAEPESIDRVKSKEWLKRSGLLEFEFDFLRREKVDRVRNFHIVEALYNEAVTLGILPLKNPLDGIEVDLKIAKVLNRV